jgi:hypothetical protein
MRAILAGLLLLLCVAGPAPAAEEARTIGRILVQREGFFRVPLADLKRLGAPSAAHVSVHDGRSEVPVNRSPAAGGDLVFLLAQHTPRYVAFGPLKEAVALELRLHATPRAGRRAPLDPAQSPKEATPKPLARLWLQDRLFAGLASARPAVYARPTPLWFLAAIPRGSRARLDLGPVGAAADQPQTLGAYVYTNTLGSVRLRAVWDGHDLGVAEGVRAAGSAGISLRWTVRAEQLPTESAALLLQDVSPVLPPPEERDVSRERGSILVDSLELAGATKPELRGETLRAWRVPASGRMRLEGKGPALLLREVDGVYDWYEPAVQADGMHAWTLEDDDAVLVGAEQAYEVHPQAWGPGRPDPHAKVRDARHVIFSVPALAAEARRLADYRTKQGLPSSVVTTTDVLDSKRYGLLAGRPVRAYFRFLQDLVKRKDLPVEYVLLVGDATVDRVLGKRYDSLPTPMTRTKWNGATSSDREYVRRGKQDVEPAIGRLPFSEAAEMRAYVDRLIRYETKPPAHTSRRTLRFVTSEGRFNPIIDKLIEGKFRSVLSRQVPPAYDVEVTYANPRSAFLWPPPELSAKVLQGLNDGALFFTYVGHGFEKGFDTLEVAGERHGILHVRDAAAVAIQHTPPIVFVLACTTAMFDGVHGPGIGEALLERPEGPVAYWGASRVCHPIYNAFVGQAIASNLGKGGALDRIGKILARSRAEAPGLAAKFGSLLNLFPAVDDVPRHFAEGAQMYTLLGDPALRVAFPKNDIGVRATVDTTTRKITVRVTAKLPDDSELALSLETPRNVDHAQPEPVANPGDPASFATIRENHRRMNDRALARQTAPVKDGTAEVVFELPAGLEAKGLVVKAWCITDGDVHQGAVILE